jgi:hypothetical protein
MQVADAIAELQYRLFSQSYQLAQLLDCRFWQCGRSGPLLGGEARNPKRVNRIGFSPR